MDPHGPPFDGGGLPDRIRVARVAGGAHRHDLRKGRGPDDPHRSTPFEVCRDEQRQAGAPLQGIELGRDVERRPDGDDQAADFERIDPARRHAKERIVERGVASREPRHDELGHALPHAQVREDRVDELGRGWWLGWTSGGGGGHGGRGESGRAARSARPRAAAAHHQSDD